MDKKQFKALINAFHENKLSAEDQAFMQRWYDSFGDDKQGVPSLDDETVKQRIEQELDERIRTSLWEDPLKRKTRFLVRRQMVAAVLAFGVVGTMIAWWFIMKSPNAAKSVKFEAVVVMREVHTGTRQVKKLMLPDGTTIYVNAHSSVRIPEKFSKLDRQIFLDEGEAFFEVAKDEKRPFVVHTKTLQVQVLGTSFNVNAYSQLPNISVAVQDGRVRVSDDRGPLRELSKDEGIYYHKEDRTINSAAFNIRYLNTWIKGRSYLERASFEELALAMHNLYGITLKSRDVRTLNYQYNLMIRTDRSLEKTMELICSIHQNQYRREGDDLVIYP